MADTTTVTPTGPFSLAASTRFLEGFTPAGYGGGDHLHLAFWVEGDGGVAGACVRQPTDHADVLVEVHGDTDPERAAAQVARILSLDVDGTGWPAVGDRDPVIGELQRRYRGLRPVTFWSAYEAAAWSVLSTRVRMAQAAALKQNISAALGTVVDIHGDAVVAFPSPAVLASALREPAPLRGLTERKATYLAGIAEAAADGRLDGPALRGRQREEALADLQELSGIGPFGAELVLLRGAGDPDRFPRQERRLAQAMAQRYGLVDPDPEELSAIAEHWRPYRTWASVLLRVAWEDRD